jgi:hypothetical protein
VPRVIDLDMLTRISILIDKYYFHEAAIFFTNMWFDALEPQVLVAFTKELMSWAFVSWVLYKPDIFRRTTTIAMRESVGEGDLRSTMGFDLPIPQIHLRELKRPLLKAFSLTNN